MIHSGGDTSSGCIKLSEKNSVGRRLFRVLSFICIWVSFSQALPGTVDNDDDFSWEDDEDDASSPTTAKPSLPPTELIKSATPTTVTPASPTSSEDVDRLAAPKSATSSPEVVSPRRQSSEYSYDVVSSQVSNAGGSKTDETPKDLEEDGDSDWE